MVNQNKLLIDVAEMLLLFINSTMELNLGLRDAYDDLAAILLFMAHKPLLYPIL